MTNIRERPLHPSLTSVSVQMSNISFIPGPLQLDSLVVLLERFNATESMILKLENQRREIWQQIEHEIHARFAANKAQMAINQEWATDRKMRNTPNQDRKYDPIAVCPGPVQGGDEVSDLTEMKRAQKRALLECEHNDRVPKGFKCEHERDHNYNYANNNARSRGLNFFPSFISALSSSASVPGTLESLAGSDAVWTRNPHGSRLISRAPSRTTQTYGTGYGAPIPTYAHKRPFDEQFRSQYRPGSPTYPSHPLLPEDIDMSSYPAELKCEGPDWSILFSSLPKVKRTLRVNLVHTLVHDGQVFCAQFSQDGKWLATGSHTAQIYDVETGVRVCVLDNAHDSYIRSVCFSPNGKYLATGGKDKLIKVWNIEKRIYIPLAGHQGTIYSLHFSSNGRFIISCSHDGTVYIWDMDYNTRQVLIIDDHYPRPCANEHAARSVAVSPNGEYVAVGSWDTVVTIWEVTTGSLVQRLRGHKDRVCCVAFTPDGRGLISGSEDKTLKYWDVSGLSMAGTPTSALTSASRTSSPCLINLTGHKDNVLSIAVSSDSAWVVSGSRDRTVMFWDARTGMPQCVLSGHKRSVLHLDLSPVGNTLVTVSGDKLARIWRYGVVM